MCPITYGDELMCHHEMIDDLIAVKQVSSSKSLEDGQFLVGFCGNETVLVFPTTLALHDTDWLNGRKDLP